MNARQAGIEWGMLKAAQISQQALEEHVREGRPVSTRMMRQFGISGEQMSKAQSAAKASAKTKVERPAKTKVVKPPMAQTRVMRSMPSGTQAATKQVKTSPILTAIHMAKTHPDPAKRQRMEQLVRKWHKAKAGK